MTLMVSTLNLVTDSASSKVPQNYTKPHSERRNSFSTAIAGGFVVYRVPCSSFYRHLGRADRNRLPGGRSYFKPTDNTAAQGDDSHFCLEKPT
jgi:hypothetical protein